MVGKPNAKLWASGFVLVLAAFLALPVGLWLARPPPIRDDNCRLDGQLAAHTVVLIDQSDPFTETDIIFTRDLIFDEAQSLPKHGKLTVIGIDGDRPDEGLQIFSRCSPGAPTRANPFFENAAFIAEDWEAKFEGEMRSEVSSLMQNEHDERSPLVEHVRGIMRRADFRPVVESRRILVVSDLHQNSPAFSVYDSGLIAESFAAVLEDIEFPSLVDVELAVLRIDRKGTFRGADIVEFWSSALTSRGLSELVLVRD